MGIGIAAIDLRTIFEMFSQVQGALSRSKGGLGIGLCLAKQLVEMHGGRIEAKSEGLGKGSEFVVRLPIVVEGTYSEKINVDDDNVKPTSDLRILVVDDNRDACSTLAMLLKMMGNNVRTAHDGDEAVQAAGEFHPQVVLLDIGLPKMNGYEVARAIREEQWGKNIILVAVTGWGQEKDKRRSEEAGFDHHMVKPLNPQALMKLLGDLNFVKGKQPDPAT
jgi:CheY-like chemotaxis protein